MTLDSPLGSPDEEAFLYYNKMQYVSLSIFSTNADWDLVFFERPSLLKGTFFAAYPFHSLSTPPYLFFFYRISSFSNPL